MYILYVKGVFNVNSLTTAHLKSLTRLLTTLICLKPHWALKISCLETLLKENWFFDFFFLDISIYGLEVSTGA